MILPTYPGKIPQTFPNSRPQFEKKSETLDLLGLLHHFGIFQGYIVGEILDLYTSHLP